MFYLKNMDNCRNIEGKAQNEEEKHKIKWFIRWIKGIHKVFFNECWQVICQGWAHAWSTITSLITHVPSPIQAEVWTCLLIETWTLYTMDLMPIDQTVIGYISSFNKKEELLSFSLHLYHLNKTTIDFLISSLLHSFLKKKTF